MPVNFTRAICTTKMADWTSIGRTSLSTTKWLSTWYSHRPTWATITTKTEKATPTKSTENSYKTEVTTWLEVQAPRSTMTTESTWPDTPWPIRRSPFLTLAQAAVPVVTPLHQVADHHLHQVPPQSTIPPWKDNTTGTDKRDSSNFCTKTIRPRIRMTTAFLLENISSQAWVKHQLPTILKPCQGI